MNKNKDIANFLTPDSKLTYNYISNNKVYTCNKINKEYSMDHNEKMVLKSKRIIRKRIITPNTSLIYILFKKTDRNVLEKLFTRHNMKNLYEEVKKALDDDNYNTFFTWYTVNSNLFVIIGNMIIDMIPNELATLKKTHRQFYELLYNNPFVSLDIQSEAEMNNVYYFHYKSSNIDAHIYTTNENLSEDYLRDIEDIYHLVSNVAINANVTNEKYPLLLRIFFSSVKKKFRKIKGILTHLTSNTGSTIRKEFINLWRKEEWKKVLIHELIHYYSLEYHYFKVNPRMDLVMHLRTKYKVNGNLSPYEALTEVLAIILHSYFTAKRLGINDYNYLLCLEKNFSLFQVSKICSLYNKKRINSILEISPLIKQSTAIFSYYIIKTAMLCSLDKILVSSEPIELIDELLNNHKFILGINSYLKDNSEISDFLSKTSRMSAIELKTLQPNI